MNKARSKFLIFIAVLAAAPFLMAAKVEPIISYQAYLTDSDGVPLDGTFDLTFRILDESDAVMWEESHAGVEVNEGFFTVVLGGADPIPPDGFVNGSDEGEYVLRYLEIQVGEDPPLTPNARLLTSPYAFASHRMAGDIFTSPGSIRMGIEPQPFNPSVEIQAMSDHSDFAFFDPLVDNDDKTVSRMSVGTGGQFSWNLFLPDTSPPRQVMDMNSDSDGVLNWTFFYPEILDPDVPALKLRTWADPDGVNGTAEIQLFSSPPFPSISPVIDLYTYEGGGGISLNEPETGFHALHTPRNISFIDSGSGVTTGIIRGDGDSYLLNNLGLGTTYTGNILSVAPNSETDPIADAWTVYSSRRWKKNIKPIVNALEKVESLRGVTFDWKANDKHDIGLIAEEVGEVIPEVVAYEENGIDAKSVDYARLVSVLIEAVKEQQETINGLERRVEELSNRVGQFTERKEESSDDAMARELTNASR